MIIDSTGSNKYTIGETQEYKTTIDIENLDFIATLLSSNLYSNPEASFIREIVSNGWDSHVEANNTNTPIVVKVVKNLNWKWDITIRDYGTGLSKEDFENIYCKIGTSTKRSSNAYLGAFGIGKFSTMAVSKVSYITSYYNGIARLYVMTKDGNNITTNLMSETPTTEHNGLEITVKNIPNIDNYHTAFCDLIFFPNVYVEGYASFVNKTKVKRYKYFSAATRTADNKILLGNVLYPLNHNIIPAELKDIYNCILHSGVVLNFNIGELTVTPNRESIIYNSKTNELIIQRLKDAIKEMKEIVIKHVPSNFDNPHKYYGFHKDTFAFDFVTSTPHFDYSYPDYSIRLKPSYLNLSTSLDNNKDVDFTVLSWFNRHKPGVKAVVTNEKVYKDKYPWRASRLLSEHRTPIMFVPDTLKLSAYLKSYLVHYHPSTILVVTPSFDEFCKDFLKGCYNSNLSVTSTKKTLEICYDWYCNNGTKIDFDTHQEFLDYKEELKKEAKLNRTPITGKVLLYHHPQYNTYGRVKRSFSNYDDAVKWIKNLKGGVFFINMDDNSVYTVSTLGYHSIAANQKVLDLLSKDNFTARVTKEDLFKNKNLIALRTIKASDLRWINTTNINRAFINTLPKELRDIYRNAVQTLSKYGRYDVEVFISKNEDAIPVDEDLLNAYNLINKCYTDFNALMTELELDNSVGLNDLISYIIMKNKIYKIGYDCYKQVKQNKLIAKLCKK